MIHSATPAAQRLSRAVAVIGLGALAVITLWSPGATRMYAWPWSLAYAAALVAPVLLFGLRIVDGAAPLALPGRSWCALAWGFVVVTLVAAFASPYRGSSLIWAAPLLVMPAIFFIAFDFLHRQPELAEERRLTLLRGAGRFLALVAVVSTALWLWQLRDNANPLSSRNSFPLGHANYTAGLALVMLPLFSALALRHQDSARLLWLGAALLALGMLFTSGSRGGLLGLAAMMALFVPSAARVLRIKPWLVIVVAIGAVGVFLVANPRTRSWLNPGKEPAPLRISDVQRAAMLEAGLRMGADRPLFGWGPGTTPLVYPRYRAQLEGGAETVLQLHSVPAQLWAELGAGGLLLALLAFGLAARAAWMAREARVVLFALSGYAVFSLTDWQLDVPVFGAALALGFALLARPAAAAADRSTRVMLASATLLSFGLVALLGRASPVPALNVRALALARDPVQSDTAIELLRDSLARDPHQEIAHFNLGWLLVVRDPSAAENHFAAAARLVPDKGGVYFGLGLARLNQEQRDAAVAAFALEALNDPLFLTSPWWKNPALRDLRDPTFATIRRFAKWIAVSATVSSTVRAEASYLAELADWIAGDTGTERLAGHAITPAQQAYFAQHPPQPNFEASPGQSYRRERTAYPVLMRDLDLPPPRDLFDVQENQLAAMQLRFLFPQKGWLPSPLLIALLDSPASPLN